MSDKSAKVLVLTGHQNPEVNTGLVDSLKSKCDVVEVATIDQAIECLRREHFSAVFSDADDFLPLERALVSQQASLILNTIGEGICLIDGQGQFNWMNKRMIAWPKKIHDKIKSTCLESFKLFTTQFFNQPTDNSVPAISRSKRYTLNLDDQQYMDLVCSPILSPGGQVVQVVAVIWDATSQRKLQQKIDAIDKAGGELVRLEGDLFKKKNVAERLKLMEEKIISYTRDLMNFDHFAIRILDRKTNKLDLVMSSGLPNEALNVELFANADNNGISGYVAARGRSYICHDVERDPRYVLGLDSAKSTLTVPLQLHDKVIGIFNIESRSLAAFNEDDRQFAEIFGRYVAIALNILNLLVTERVETSLTVTDTVNSEVAGPINDIASELASIMEDHVDDERLHDRLDGIVKNVDFIRSSLRNAARGPNTVLGARDVTDSDDPIISGKKILVADDDDNIRSTIAEILRKYRARVTVASSGAEAIELIHEHQYDLVVSDIKMPDKTGYDVFHEVREVRAGTPVILMTGFGYDPNHSIVRASQEGLAAVLYKPFKVDNLITEVRKALQSKVRN